MYETTAPINLKVYDGDAATTFFPLSLVFIAGRSVLYGRVNKYLFDAFRFPPKYFLCQHLDRGDLKRIRRPAY